MEAKSLLLTFFVYVGSLRGAATRREKSDGTPGNNHIMIKGSAILVLLSLAVTGIAQGQRVTGRVVNSGQQPVEGATIIMLTSDSLY